MAYYTKKEQMCLAKVFERFCCDRVNAEGAHKAVQTEDEDNQFAGCDIMVDDYLRVDCKARISKWYGRISMDLFERRDFGYSIGWMLDDTKTTDWLVFYGYESAPRGIIIHEYTVNATILKNWYLNILAENNLTVKDILNKQSARDKLCNLFLEKPNSVAPMKMDYDKQRQKNNHTTLYLCIYPDKLRQYMNVKERHYFVEDIIDNYNSLLSIKYSNAVEKK